MDRSPACLAVPDRIRQARPRTIHETHGTRPPFGGASRHIMMLMETHHDATIRPMRTTINLDPDIAAAVERLRRTDGLGLSEAVNRLARTGLVGQKRGPRFKQRTMDLGAMVDVSNVAEVLGLIEGPEHR